MTDEQLIELVQSKTPEELNLEELEALQQGLRQSAALREALLDRLHLEQYLGDALGRIEVSVDHILERARRQAPPGPSLGRLLGWGVACLLVLGGLAVWFSNRLEDPAVQQIAQQEPGLNAEEPAHVEPELNPEQPARPPQAPEAANAAAAKQDSATGSETQPAAAEPGAVEPGTAAAPFRLAIQAEDFNRGNVEVDRRKYGGDFGIVYYRKPGQGFVEYDIDVPATGSYRLDLRYASDEVNPLKLKINGQEVPKQVADKDTGGWDGRGQKWHEAGVYPLVKGRNTLRLEMPELAKKSTRYSRFPMLDQLAVSSSGKLAPGEPVAPVPPADPWQEVLASNDPPPAFAEVCFDDIDQNQALRAADLQRWLEQVEGQSLKIREQASSSILEGLGRLRSPWREDLALRLALHDHHGLKLHFWNGGEGVTLWYYAYPPTWAAYTTTRKSAAHQPETYALAATDNHRFVRSGAGTFELRHAEGKLVMTRGDIALLTVPMPRPPEEVYFEGRASVRGLTLVRSQGLPADAAPRPTALLAKKPASMAWKLTVPDGAELKKLPAGPIELSAGKTKAVALASLPVQEHGLYEAIFELENPQPGTGIFLGDAQGRPLHQVGFFRDARSGATSFAFLAPGDNRTQSNHDLNQHPVPYALKRQWLRLVLGCGTLKCWTSADGEHWSRALAPLQNPDGLQAYSQLGLYCLSGDEPRQIRLLSVEVRELGAISELAPREVLERGLALTGDADMDLGLWLQTVIENQPQGVEPNAWRRACAIRTLAAGPRTRLGIPLLMGLLEEGLARSAPGADRLRLLDEIALIAPTWEGAQFQELAVELARRYEHLGKRLAEQGEVQPYNAVGRALMTAPIMTDVALPIVPESLVRRELLGLIEQDRWEEVVALCQRLEYWNRSVDPGKRTSGRESLLALTEWAQGSAFRSLPARRAGTATVLRAEWRHPLVEVLSKEGYNILAEFNAALDGESYTDACQIISNSDPRGALGLLPDSKDTRLLVSLPAAVSMAMREHPRLRQTMNEQFGPRGRLRVQQAMAETDLTALEAATTQFNGTPAAAEAHLWLGDRALSSGDFTRAIGQYRFALAGNLPDSQVQPRLRLAAAMLGRDEGQPVTEPVVLADATLPAAEFERLVAEMLKRQVRDESRLPALKGTASPVSAPLPAQYEARRWAEFNGPVGENAQQVPYPDHDWAGRQLSTLVADNTLYVGNRFQLSAYDLKSGQKRWDADQGNQQGQTHSWPFMPMQPVAAGDRLFLRRIAKQGPELICLNDETGKVVWKAKLTHQVVSDPMLVQDQLFVLSAGVAHEPQYQVYLSCLDPLNGDVLSQRPLVQLRDAGNRQIFCQATVVDDRIVASVGGGVLCCDLLGQVRWLRRQTWLPQALDASWADQYRQPPLVVDGLVLVSQPGAGGIECLDLVTGRRRWQRVLPDFRRLIGVDGENLILETSAGLEGVAVQTGQVAWRREVGDLLHAAACGTGGGLLYACRQRIAADQSRVALVWLDSESGAEHGRCAFSQLSDKTPFAGPLVMHEDRLWMFFGRGREATREIYELGRKGPLPRAMLVDDALRHWNASSDALLSDAARAVLPGWTLLSGETDKQTRLHAEVRGRHDVLATLASTRRPTRFVRALKLPPGARAKLVLTVGHDPEGQWGLDVRVGGDSLLSQAIEPGSTKEGWRQIELDLSKYAGREEWLFVCQRDAGKKPGYAYWQQMEVVLLPQK